jgi:hypothetical protein
MHNPTHSNWKALVMLVRTRKALDVLVSLREALDVDAAWDRDPDLSSHVAAFAICPVY